MVHRLFRAACMGLFVCAALLTAVPPATAADPASATAPDTRIPSNPQVRTGTLANGLRYYIQRRGKPAHRLELRLVVKAGSVLEDDDQQGVAHFVEHMAFNGSTHFRKHELVSWLQSIGVRYGADLNAFTSFDETIYVLPVPTQRGEDVARAFTILEDWAHGVSFDDADIEKERAIVLEEARLHHHVEERVEKATRARLHAGSRYPVRFPMGKEDVLRSAGPDALRRFYRDWYRPDLMAVVAVGDIDPDEGERQIAAHFGGLRNPSPERVRSRDEIQPFSGRDAMVLTDPEMSSTSINVHYPARQMPQNDKLGDFRRKLMQRLVYRMAGLRLTELAHGANPPFIAAGFGLTPLTATQKAPVAWATIAPGASAAALMALAQEQQRIRRDGFSAAELALARDYVSAVYYGFFKGGDTADSAQFAAEYIRNFLTDEPFPGPKAEFELAARLLPGITLEEVKTCAREIIPPADAPDALSIYMSAGREGKAAPDRDRLLAEALAAGRASAPPRTETKLAGRLMARPAAPGAILAESADASMGVTRLVFDNGINVILKRTSNEESVQLAAERYGGEAMFGEKDLVQVRAANQLVHAMGVPGVSDLDVRKLTAVGGANVSLTIEQANDVVAGSSSNDLRDVEKLLQLVWLRFSGVRRDEAAFRAWTAAQETALRQRDAAPEARFEDAVQQALFVKNPYVPRPFTLADLSAIDLDRSLALYRRRFSSAKGFTFILAGNVDPDAVKPLLAAYLGTLPAGDLPLDFRDTGVGFARGVVERELQAGTEPKSTLVLGFSGDAGWSPEEKLRFDAMLEVIQLRIDDVLREKLRLLYVGKISGAMYLVPGRNCYLIRTWLPTAPGSTGQLEAALMAEIERLKRDGPSTAELEKVKRTWRQEWARTEQSNSYWVELLKLSSTFGIDPQRFLRRGEQADALGAEDVREAARRYFDTGNHLRFVLNPETAAPAASPGAVTTAR